MTRHTNEFDWPADAVEQLRVGRARGDSFARIARQIGNGVSRNAAIGKARRMKLPSAAQPTFSTQSSKPRKRKRPFVIQHSEPQMPRTLPPEEPSAKHAVTTALLEPGMCKWPTNDGVPKWMHCGAPTDAGPYCVFHQRRSEGGGTRGERSAA